MGVNGIYGLSGSGLDIESMVKVGMMSKQNEYDKMAQKYTKNEWTKAAYIELNSSINSFNLTKLSSYKMSSNMNAKSAVSSSDAIKVTANASADFRTHSVEVDNLVSSASLVGTNKMQRYAITSDEANQSSMKLADVFFANLEYDEDAGTVFGNIAAVNMTAAGRTTTASTDLTKAYSFGKDVYDDFSDAAWNATTARFESNGGNFYTNSDIVWANDDGTEQWQYDSASDNWQKYNSTTGNFENVIPNFSSATWDGSKLATNDGSYVSELSWSTNSGLEQWKYDAAANSWTEYNSNEDTWNEATPNFIGATWDGTKLTLSDGSEITDITWKTADNEQWQYDANANGNWAKYNSSTDTFEGVIPDFVNASWDGSNLTTNDGYHATNLTWATDDDNWTKESDLIFTQNVASGDVNTSEDAFSFTISDGTNSTDISYTYDQLLGLNGETAVTFYDLVNKINNSGLNIKASYDSEYDRFSFYNTKSGTGNDIQITFDSDLGDESTSARANLVARNFFSNMGLYQSVNGTLKGEDGNTSAETDSNYLLFKLGDNTFEGKDATIRIDGMSYNSKDNKITRDGITYEAVDETKGTARVSVSQDVDAIIEKVKTFVEDYNTLLSSLYEKYDEKPDSNYKPLTQSQKDAMKEEQIEKWEEKAKKGVLYHDQTLSKIILNMRSAVSNQIDLGNGQTTSAYSIGISTVAGNIKGQLTLDEDKLRKALANDSDAVYNVFAKLDANDMSNSAKSGIAQRLGDVFTTANKSIKSRAGSSTDVVEDSDLNNLLRQLQTRMSDFKKMMNAFEDKLYKKYDTMESTLARLGTQLNFISGVGQG